MTSRRTRTTALKASAIAFPNGINIGDAANGIMNDDRFFASPKRKDCKLDMPSVPSMAKSPQIAAAMNGKRAPKNAHALGKQKKATQPITKFFNINGHHTSAKVSSDNDDVKSKPLPFQLNGDSSEFPALPQSPMNSKKKPQQPMIDVANGESCEAFVFLSPPAKLVNGNGIKQTTPHRIFALTSPTKKQRLYAKNNPVNDDFEQLNIDEDSSAKSKATNKREQQRSRRKLIVHETENVVANEPKTDTASTDDIVPLQHGGNAAGVVGAAIAVDTKKPILNSTVDPSAQQNTTNNKKLMAAPVAVPNRAPRETQLTDFFPIRRSVRKTKKTVEQEQLRYIEMAIEKQLEDGLVVKTFAEKGRGIVAGRPFARGEFVVEYIGQLIDQTEADRREESYAKNVDFGCYMYYFKHKEQQWCIDATEETGKLGRLVNHSRNGNLMTKIVSYRGLPHLVLLAKEDIKAGEELTYDYGDRRREALIHHPWLAF